MNETLSLFIYLSIKLFFHNKCSGVAGGYVPWGTWEPRQGNRNENG